MDLNKIQAIVDSLRVAPEVTKNEAFACFMNMGDRIDACDEKCIEAMAEIVGMACTCDNPEMVRRFIKYVSIHGPIA